MVFRRAKDRLKPMSIRVKIWGCRGSIACPAPTHLKYGGNTTCLEVDAGNQKFILDCGTGIRNLGQNLSSTDFEHCDILLTHTHWDHINGFPFFAPAFSPAYQFDMYAGHLMDKGGVQTIMETQMDNPMFPVPLEAMQADLKYVDFEAGDNFYLFGDIRIKTAPLNHPNGSTAYRVEHQGKAVLFLRVGGPLVVHAARQPGDTARVQRRPKARRDPRHHALGPVPARHRTLPNRIAQWQGVRESYFMPRLHRGVRAESRHP